MATMKRMLAHVWPSTDRAFRDSFSTLNGVRLDSAGYNEKVEEIRDIEYPNLVGTTYLDHAGTTPYAKSTVENWTAELTANLFGNPHSASAASQLSTRRIDDIRLKVLKFYNASPDDFDVVFVANATAAIKLVAEAFRDNVNGFWYGFHADSHTSLVGCRELAVDGSECFPDDESLETWIATIKDQFYPLDTLQLVAYPGQSNMTGRRLSLRYCEQIRRNASESGRRIYTLLDAASLVSTASLDLSDASAAPDFIAMSFYKIFGFPDLGALIVRKQSAEVLMQKRYFAGGTVDGVALSNGGWHIKKSTLHSLLEEGTLPFHNILALDHAMNTHTRLFGSMNEVSNHSRYLADQARRFLSKARHASGTRICDIYSGTNEADHGPIVAFNLMDGAGNVLSASEVEKLCIVKGIQLRTGGLCNPGGIARHLDLSTDRIKSNYLAGRRCGGESELMEGKPTGTIRISFGAMSTKADLYTFTNFIEEYYVEQDVLRNSVEDCDHAEGSPYVIHSLSIYPIKSCAAFEIPRHQRWQVTGKGLIWDREWCLVHQGTGAALSQKRYPRMTLLQPSIDTEARKMTITHMTGQTTEVIEIDLDETPTKLVSAQTCPENTFKLQDSKVCGDTIPIHVYSSSTINDFFSKALNVPCCLARYPRDTEHRRKSNIRKPTDQKPLISGTAIRSQPQLALSNESPILVVSSSSVNEINRKIAQNAQENGRLAITVSPSSFRANIVVSQLGPASAETPYIEDTWTSLHITRPTESHLPLQRVTTPREARLESSDTLSDRSLPTSGTSSLPGSFSNGDTDVTTLSSRSEDFQELKLDILGPCQRCQMLTINQSTAVSQQEPFCTLAKTRRKGDGRVWFGVHASLAGATRENASDMESEKEGNRGFCVAVGDRAVPSYV